MDDALSQTLEAVTLDAPWNLVTTFSTLPRWKPEDVNAAGLWIAEQLKKLGVPVKLHAPELYLSIPYEAGVSVGKTTFHAKTPSYSISAPDGVRGQLIHVPAVQSKSINNLFAANLTGNVPKDLTGKIAITEGYGIPQKIAELEKAGAVAVITINPGVDIHWAICTPIWGTPGLTELSAKPTIPVVSVNQPDGLSLVELAKQGETATVSTRLDEGWFKQYVVVTEIPGPDDSGDFVLVHGHYDSWDVGVGDNATGNATLLELANVRWQKRAGLKRSVHIAWWPGHSTGRYAGSTWYADAFAQELDEHCVAHINCDSPGCRWATEYRDLAWTPETAVFVQKLIEDVTGLDSEGGRAPRAGDWSFNNIGLSGFFMLSSTMPQELAEKMNYYAVGGCGGNIGWHTENDLLDLADREILERDIKLYLAAAWSVANADILPFDWKAAVTTLKQAIEKYQAATGDAFSFARSKELLDRLAAALDAFYGKVNAGKLPPESANAVIKQLARILVPLDHSEQPRFMHDPALPRTAIPALGLANIFPSLSAEKKKFAATELTRKQNAVVSSLCGAVKLVEAATGT